MKTYKATLTIKENGTNNKIKLTAKKLTGEAFKELQELFVWEHINDGARLVRSEIKEGIDVALSELKAEGSTVGESSRANDV